MSTHTHHEPPRLDAAAEWNTLHAQALHEARALRRQAWADFWHGADGVLARGRDPAQRSAQRLADSLRRHRNARRRSGGEG